MTAPPACDQRFELGAYLLDALDPRDRAAYQKHLMSCAECRAEFAELAGLPDLLAHVDRDTVLADSVLSASATRERPRPEREPAAVIEFDAREAPPPVARRELPGQRNVPPPGRKFLVAALAALALVIGGALALTSLVSSGSTTSNVKLVAAAGTSASGSAQLRPSGTGSVVTVVVTGVPPGTWCDIFLTDKAGKPTLVRSWKVNYYSEPSSEEGAARAVRPNEVSRVLVVDRARHTTLLTGSFA